MYTHLDPYRTVATIEKLQRRIEERFRDSGLAAVCGELCATAHASRPRIERIARPNLILRGAVALVVVLMFAVLVYTVSLMDLRIRTLDAAELVQVAEAAINDLVLVGAAIFFLVTVETRMKRARTLEALDELRAIAHVIDMHQLTKDPGRYGAGVILTDSSPKQPMSSFELMRYLDYCSEMLSLTGKVAALYAQSFRDPVALAAVNEIEGLTTGLSRKIWQKIMILHRLDESDGQQSIG
jgi:hypothetical protein